MDDQEKQPHLLRWEPGMKLSTETEEEYQAATARLAKELMRDYTQEQLATITAQHVLYLDLLTDTNDSIKRAASTTAELVEFQKKQLQRSTLENEVLVKDTMKIAKIVLDARNKQRARKAALASHEGDHANMAAALADWDASGHTYSTRRSFAKNNHNKYNVKDFTTVYGWLLKHRKPKS